VGSGPAGPATSAARALTPFAGGGWPGVGLLIAPGVDGGGGL